MRVAQTLYENGYITYMRTDSTALSRRPSTPPARQARRLYGPETVPDKPRMYANKAKNAQEAHEAIRPAGDSFRTPGQVSGSLRGEEFRLYELIWKRTVASPDGRRPRLHRHRPPRRVVTRRRPRRRVLRRPARSSPSGASSPPTRRAATRSATPRTPTPSGGCPSSRRARRSTCATSRPTGTRPRRRRATPRPAWCEALEERGIGRPSTYAATIADDRRPWLRAARAVSALVPAGSRSRSPGCSRSTSAGWSTTTSPPAMEADLDRIAGGQERRADWLRASTSATTAAARPPPRRCRRAATTR